MHSPVRSAKSNETSSKWSTFFGMYIGYTLAIFNRKCFSFALPAIMNSLELDKNEAGLISSSQNLAYTISKFFGGILCDTVNVKLLFCLGLFGSGLLTVSLSAFRSAAPFAVILFLQGIFQGGGWPACAKILKGWTDPALFGCLWGLLSSSMNVACAVGPLATSYLLQYYPWQSCFVFYGIAAVLGSLLSYVMIQWPVPKNMNQDNAATDELKGRGDWRDLMSSPFMWVVCCSNFVIFMGRTTALDWGQLYLVQELNHSSHVGSLFISSMEIGGVVGSVLSGYVADVLVMRNRSSIAGTPRMTVAMVFVFIFTLSLHCFLFLFSAATSESFIAVVGFFMGFGVYGPISIYGVVSIEASPIHLQGTSHAIVALAANVGAITAGLPFSNIAKHWDWRGAFIILELMLILTLILKIATRNLTYKTVSTKKKIQ